MFEMYKYISIGILIVYPISKKNSIKLQIAKKSKQGSN